MRKLLSILGTMVLIGTASTNVIACCNKISHISKKINISNKIPSAINLGQLSTTNKSDFLVKLQSKLVTLTDLSSIQLMIMISIKLVLLMILKIMRSLILID